MPEPLTDSSVATLTGADCTLRLYWLREPALGFLRTGSLPRVPADPEPLACAISTAGDLPVADATSLAQRLLSLIPRALARQAARSGSPVVDIQLPAIPRKVWSHRREILAASPAEVDGEGRILVRNGMAPQLESDVRMALAAGLPSASRDFSLSFTDTRSLTPLQVRLGLPIMLERYGFNAEDISWLQSHRDGLEASLTLSLPGECGTGWISAPGERATSFFETYVQLAKAVQATLRQWVPYVYFRDAASYADRQFGMPLAVYQAMRPFRGSPRATFTYDVLNTTLVELAYRVAERHFQPFAGRIEAALQESGFGDYAALYAHTRLDSLFKQVRKQRRSMNSLLAGDSVLVEAFVKLGTDASAIAKLVEKNSEAGIKAFSKACAEFVKVCHGKLKRLYAVEDFSSLAPVLLIEATRTLRPEFPIRATLRIESSRGSYVLSN